MGSRIAAAISKPRTNNENVMPPSIKGMKTANMLNMPPNAMAEAKLSGTSQTALPPSCAAHNATAIMAAR